MKKKYLIIGSMLFFQFVSEAQQYRDSSEKKISKYEIDLVYNQYIQDGNNSAVTGGRGTEELTVYGPSVQFRRYKNNHVLKLNLGADIISSASTDKIDFVVSSASVLDTRTYFNTVYEHRINENSSVQGGIGFSIESDYFSIGSKVGFSKDLPDSGRTIDMTLEVYNDDLRWGRLSPDHYKPVKLIYPAELRKQEWYDEYRRNSYNIKVGITQVINKRNIIGIFPELTYQKGLLATPFHRVYFTDGTVRTEQLPGERWKAGLGMRINTFWGGSVITKNGVNGYGDSFGIYGLALENETAFKLNPVLYLIPHLRFYMQKGAEFFSEYGQHNINDLFYTSDYDLSSFRTINVGAGMKFNPFKSVFKWLQFNAAQIRYSFFYRTDGMKAHIMTIAFQTESRQKKKSPGSDF